MTKKDFGDIIAEKMNKAGVKVPRLGKHIVNKIKYLEKSFKSAHDFAHTSTGAGLMETHEGTFQDAIKRSVYIL
jgi:ubiquinone biosynthesis protein Coq4